MDKTFWKFLKISFILGLKAWPRLMVAPIVGAFRGVAIEAERLDAQIDACVEREIGKGPISGGR